MWIALAVPGVIVLAGLIYLATLDGNFRVRRSREVDVPRESAFAAIVDFESWPEWSPWLMHEPNAKLEYSDDYRQEGGNYSWDGKIIGAGRLTHVNINQPDRIEQRIEFVRPFKTRNQVIWEFEDRGDKTLVTWEMIGRMPFLFRFMAKRMEPMIERDYDLGLALLNGYLNASSPHPAISFIGEQQLENFSYWAIPCNGNLRQLEKARPAAIETLTAAAAGKTGLALTLFHRFDPMASQFRAEIAIPITDNMPASNYTRREFGGGRYFRLDLAGAHEFLPLAWYALSCHCRMYRIKPDPSRPALEIYHHNPAESSDSNPVVTALYMPIR